MVVDLLTASGKLLKVLSACDKAGLACGELTTLGCSRSYQGT